MKIPVRAGVLVAVVVSLAAVRADADSRTTVPRRLLVLPPPADLLRGADDAPAAEALEIDNVRIEVPPANTPMPSSLLKFDMRNTGAGPMRDVLIEVSVVQKAVGVDGGLGTSVVVRPFRVGGQATIEAGYTVQYEMLLRNVNPECTCVANVRIVSARTSMKK